MRFPVDPSLARFKSVLKSTGQLEPVVLRKAYIAEVTKATGSTEPVGARTLKFTVSTAGVDRDQDQIDPKGWDFTNFRKAPRVMWAHDYDQLPIGRALSLNITPAGKLVSVAEFTAPDLNPFGDTVYRMCEAGFLNTTSVGFKPLEADYDEGRKGVNFKKLDLLEWSVVPIPSNPEALMEAKSKGIDLAPIRQWAEYVRETYPAQPETVSHATLEHALTILKGSPVSVSMGSWKGFEVLVQTGDEAPRSFMIVDKAYQKGHEDCKGPEGCGDACPKHEAKTVTKGHEGCDPDLGCGAADCPKRPKDAKPTPESTGTAKAVKVVVATDEVGLDEMPSADLAEDVLDGLTVEDITSLVKETVLETAHLKMQRTGRVD